MNQLLPRQSNSPDLCRDLRSIARARWKLDATPTGTQGAFAADHPESIATESQTRRSDVVRIQPEPRDDHPGCRHTEGSFPRSVQSRHNASVFPAALSTQEPVPGSAALH